MFEKTPYPAAVKTGAPELRKAIELLSNLVLEGVEHGHFDYSVTCETAKQGRRMLIVRAGKSHKFAIEEEDLIGK
jgi:hypothetical protein